MLRIQYTMLRIMRPKNFFGKKKPRVISAAAALAAVTICPAAAGYMLASHVSREPAHQMVLDRLGLTPVIHGQMCLGEGTGAVALFPLLDMAAAVYGRMRTFQDIQIEEYRPLS